MNIGLSYEHRLINKRMLVLGKPVWVEKKTKQNRLVQGPVPERPIIANPGLKFCSTFCILPSYALLRVKHFVLSFLFFEVKTQQYFVSSSYRFLDRKTLLKIWLNSGLNLTIFRIRGTRGPFLERPGNFSGPKANFEIKTCLKVAQFLTRTRVQSRFFPRVYIR